MPSTFKYKPRSPDAWEKRANQQGGSGLGVIKDDYKTWTPAKGDNHIRILPPTWEDAEHYGLDIYVHYGIGPDRSSILCINKMQNKRCPLCEAKQKADRAGDTELANELNAGKRVALWMLDRKDESKGPMIWTMPWTLDRDFVKVSRDRDGEIYMLDDPEEGYNISFERTGEQITTKYVGVKVDRKPTSVDQDIIDYIVAEPLTEAFVYLSYDEIKRTYEGGNQDEAPADDTPPAKEESKLKPRGRAARDPEPESAAAGDNYTRDKEPAPARDPEPEETPRKPAARAERRSDPEPDPEPVEKASTGGKSRADELRAKYGNRK